MYRALYSFKGQGNQYLSFEPDDRFTALAVKGEWIWAQNGFGDIGYIPTTYVVKENAAYLEVLKSIDRAIEVIHFEASKRGNYTHQQRENLQKLVQHREYVVSEEKKEENPSECEVNRCQQKETVQDTKRSSVKRAAPPPPSLSSNRVQCETVSSSSDKIDSPKSSNTCNNKDAVVVSSVSVSDESGQPGKVNELQKNESRTLDDKRVSGTVDHSNSLVHQQNSDPKKTSEISSPSNVQGIVASTQSISASEQTSKKTQDVTDSLCDKQSQHSLPIGATSKIRNAVQPDLQISERSDKIDVDQLLLPSTLGPQLIEEVRKGTDLNYQKSKVAVDIVLGYIGYSVPSLTSLMDKILSSLQNIESPEVESSHDAQRLRSLFSELTACKDDSQQRSWALHEDESIISGNLKELISILDDAKPSICSKVIREENYECVHHIVQYYQMLNKTMQIWISLEPAESAGSNDTHIYMVLLRKLYDILLCESLIQETRLKLRLLLLEVFGAFCRLDKMVISLLLYSVLPLELVRELKAHCDDVHRLNYVSLVLTMIFSMGEPLPLNLHELINLEYLNFLIDLIENPRSLEHEEKCTDQLVNLLLAYNLHLKDTGTNHLMKVLADKRTAGVLTEKLLLIFNRGDDPVDIFHHKPRPNNSVMKFFHDLYTSEQTSNLLYTNDAQVLIGIILRHLVDSSPGEQVRTDHLYLLQLLLKNSDYIEHQHRLNDLKSSLNKIMNEEENIVKDKQIAKQIMDTHKSFF